MRRKNFQKTKKVNKNRSKKIDKLFFIERSADRFIINYSYGNKELTDENIADIFNFFEKEELEEYTDYDKTIEFIEENYVIEIKGEVNSPVFKPEAFKIDEINVHVEPFPFVPATCTNFKSFCGFPSISSNNFTRSNPGLIPNCKKELTYFNAFS